MNGIKYISAIEAAERWHLSRRRVVALCGDGRIIGAQKAGVYWIIPENANEFRQSPRADKRKRGIGFAWQGRCLTAFYRRCEK